jgi:hypothetical protein
VPETKFVFRLTPTTSSIGILQSSRPRRKDKRGALRPTWTHSEQSGKILKNITAPSFMEDSGVRD